MPTLEIHYAPGTCARASLIALEETGAPFEARLVRFMKADHKAPDYLALNPKGKVPLLVADGKGLTENVAILSYLNETFPNASLLPKTSSPLEKAQQIADLCFCGSTLHPFATRLRFPQFMLAHGAAVETIRGAWEKTLELIAPSLKIIDERLAGEKWWYGDRWSVMDGYLFWVFSSLEKAALPFEDYPNYADHYCRCGERPSVKRAVTREGEALKLLESQGLVFKPPAPPKA